MPSVVPPLQPTPFEQAMEAARLHLQSINAPSDAVEVACDLLGIPTIVPLRYRSGGRSTLLIAERIPKEGFRVHTQIAAALSPGGEQHLAQLPDALAYWKSLVPSVARCLIDDCGEPLRYRWLEADFYCVEGPLASAVVLAGWNPGGELCAVRVGAYFGAAERQAETAPLPCEAYPLAAPFRVIWGGTDPRTNYHAASRQQRYAIDAEPLSHEDRVLSMSEGRVLESLDTEDDGWARSDPRRAANVFGNYVKVRHGPAVVYYAHLRLGSVRVAAGDRLHPGTELGRVGNSGWSSRAHLHVHAESATGSRLGIPIRFPTLRAPDLVRANIVQ